MEQQDQRVLRVAGAVRTIVEDAENYCLSAFFCLLPGDAATRIFAVPRVLMGAREREEYFKVVAHEKKR